MDQEVGKQLLELSTIDTQILSSKHELSEKEKTRKAQVAQIQQKRNVVAETTKSLQQKEMRQKSEEARLQEEQNKISDRRRQLATMGGSKAAKFAEREVDVATKAVDSLEETLLASMEETEATRNQLTKLQAELQQLETQFEASTATFEAFTAKTQETLGRCEESRKTILANLPAEMSKLYERIRAKFPGGAVAKIDGATCGACSMSLPPMVKNQLIQGGTPVQCPGCQRMLVLMQEAT